MKNVKRHLMIALAACATVLAFQTGAAGNDNIKHQARAPIVACAEDGTTWIAGEARFSVVGSTLDVHVDLATGIPNAQVWVDVFPEVIEPMPQMVLTDEQGNLKWKGSYQMLPRPALAVDAVVEFTVEGASVGFASDKSVTIEPN